MAHSCCRLSTRQALTCSGRDCAGLTPIAASDTGLPSTGANMRGSMLYTSCERSDHE